MVRPDTITLQAYNLAGQEFHQEISGMLARVVQHETDHLDGVLFIDRLTEPQQVEIRDQLAEFEMLFAGRSERGELPSEKEILARLAELEQSRC